MTMSTLVADSPTPQYARFSRRLQGMFVDWAIMLVTIFGALLIASAARDDTVSRILGIAVVLVLLLYEPLLVARTGGTIGHHLTNLRVVDETHGGNVSFLKAVGRFAIKSLIGWFSFIVMAATRRNQAIHDLATRSTVQIKDSTKSSAAHFITERKFENPNMPSRVRRIAVICGYLLLTFAIFTGIEALLQVTGTLSQPCALNDVCSPREWVVVYAHVLAFFATCAVCIVFGWRGRLVGARIT